jgi:hypothetical protein
MILYGPALDRLFIFDFYIILNINFAFVFAFFFHASGVLLTRLAGGNGQACQTPTAAVSKLKF